MSAQPSMASISGRACSNFEFGTTRTSPRRKGGQEGGARRKDVLLRIFCHAYGDRVVLLLGGYDKGVAPSSRQQAKEIETARSRLRSFQLRLKRRKAGDRRRG
jgi:hypothetical protein